MTTASDPPLRPPQQPPRKTPLTPHNILRRAHSKHHAAARAALGARIDQPVGGFDDVQLVPNHHNRVARVAQPAQYFAQERDVGKVPAGSGFVQYVEGAAGVALGQF